MPVTSVYRTGRGSGVVSDPGPSWPTIPGIPKALPPTLGNVLRVDVGGNDQLASIGGTAYGTISAALAAATSGTTVWVMPGTYNIPIVANGLVIPAGVSLRGVSTQTVNINYTGGSANTNYVMFAPAADTRIEDVTLNCNAITATGTTTTTAMLVQYPESTKIRTCVINVTSTATDGSSAYGIRSTTLASGTPGSVDTSGNPTAKMFSFNTVKGITVNVFSSGSGASGARRGILVDGTTASCMTCRDANIYIGAPTGANPGTGTYVGVETNCTSPATGQGTVQLRNCSVGSCVGSLLANTAGYFTASDVLQTTPTSVTPGTTKTGIILGAGTDLITKTAGNKPLTVTTFPQTLSYNLKGTGTGWLSQGIQTTPDSLNNAPFTGQYFVTTTTAGSTDNITLNTTAGLSIGMPIQFGTALNTVAGNIDANTTYYIHKVTATAIQVATTAGGSALTSTVSRTSSVTIPTITSTLPGTTTPTSLVSANLTASGVTNQYVVTSITTAGASPGVLTANTTAGLVIGQPVQFSTALQNNSANVVTANSTVYINTIPSTTTFTIRDKNTGGTAYALDTVASSTNIMTLITDTLSVSSTTTGQYRTISATGGTVSMNSVTGLTYGQPIIFGSTFTSTTSKPITAGITYYISAINATVSPPTITVTSANTSGVVVDVTAVTANVLVTPTVTTTGFPLPTVSASATSLTINNHNFVVGTSIKIGAVSYGGLAAGSIVYVKSVGDANTITVTKDPGGSAYTFTSAVTVAPTDATINYNVCGAATSSAWGTVTASGGGSSATVFTLSVSNTTAPDLVPGMPIIFGTSNISGITAPAGTPSAVFYVRDILSSGITGTFTLYASGSSGAAFTSGSANTAYYAAQTLAPSSNPNLQFINFSAAHNLVIGDGVVTSLSGQGLTQNQTYFVQTAPSTTMISLTTDPSTVQTSLVTTQLGTIPATLNPVHTINKTNYASLSVNAATANSPILTIGGGAPSNLLSVGMPIVFAASPGTGISAYGGSPSNTYFVRSVLSTTTFTVSSTAGGTVVTPTAAGSAGTVWISALTSTASSNLVTFSAAHNLLVGDAVVFNAALGPFSAATLYYVVTQPNTTQVMLSTLPGGVAVAITDAQRTGSAATGALVYYNASTGSLTCPTSGAVLTLAGGANTTLSPGMPIVFGTTVSGTGTSLNAGTVYYIISNPAPSSGATGTFSVAASLGAASGIAPAPTNAPVGISYSAFSTGIQPQYFVTGASGLTITLNTTAGLSIGMPIQFGTTLTGTNPCTAGVTYYIATIPSGTTITATDANTGGTGRSGLNTGITSSLIVPYTATSLTVTTLTASSANTVTTSVAHNLVLGNVVVFGASAAPFTAGTYYYVFSTPSNVTFTLAPTQGGSVISIAATSTVSVSATGYYTFTNSTVPSMASFASGGLITLSNGPTNNQLVPGMPIIFGSSFGSAPASPTATPTNIVAGQTYYVASNPAPTAGGSGTFYVSLSPGGPAIGLTGSTTTSALVAFALAGGPPSVRIQTPSLLVGLATTLNNVMGLTSGAAGNSLIITVYRTPASGGPTAATSFTVTYSPNDATTVNKLFFDSSLSLAAGDRIQALAVSQGSSIPRDITAQLILV